ncbi:MAG: amino acid permease [Candidatus Hodarchaeales archaeon]|jgi:amino acid transporter/nucleotide-binding universal stress UspA family protein
MATETHSHTEFAKELGLKEAFTIAVGAMIGGGIFSVLGRLAGLAGPFAVVSFFLGGLISLLTAHSYIKLVSKYPSAGGEFVILRRGFENPLIGNTVGALLWLGYSVTIALYAFTFGLYTSEWLYELIFEFTGHHINFFNPSNLEFISFRRIMAATAVLSFMAINLKGVKESGNIQNVIVAFKLGVLILLAIVGLFFIQTGRFIDSWESIDKTNGEAFALFNGVFVGGAIIFVSYEGFQVIANTVEELKNPTRDVRIGMYISVVTVCITYMAVTFVTIGLVDGEIDEAALIQAVRFLGPIAVTLITLGAIASTTSAINATLLGSSRLAYVMSDWKAFPKRLAVISKKTKVPYLAIIITSGISLGFTFLGNASAIAEVASIIFLFIFLSINLSVIKIYRNDKNWLSRVAVALIILDIILAFYYLIVEHFEESTITFTVLIVFTAITIVWMVINQRLLKQEDVNASGYVLDPLGSELIREFKHSDSSDQFFADLDNLLLPVAGKVYETKNIEISAYLAKKFNVKITLLNVVKHRKISLNGLNGRKNHKNRLTNAKSILNEYKVNYNIITREGKDVAETICDVYREGNYQLISMASRRKSGFFDRLFDISVSKNVVKNVSCTVLQVHPPKYGKRKREIGDIFLMLDGSERDSYITRWAKLISSVGQKGRVFAYHMLELPHIFPLDEAPKVQIIRNSQLKFENYAVNMGKRFGLAPYPVFLYGHSMVKSMKGETEKYEPDAIVIGHTKDKGLRHRFRTKLSYRIMRKIDSAVIVHHMPEDLNNT